tara:strand:+ start:3662 stop:5314 length:1653 start_codon:yes stop_codon:yes gene_type:complete
MKKVIKYLKDNHFKKSIALIFFSILSGFIEIVNIGMLIPILSVFLEVSSFDDNSNIIFKFVENYLMKVSLTNLILIFLSVNIFKIIFLIFINIYKSSFVNNISNLNSLTLLKRYAKANLFEEKKININLLMRNIIIENKNFTHNVITPFIEIISEIFVIIIISSFILFVSIKEFALIITIFTFFIAIFYLTLRKINYTLGSGSLSLEGIRINLVKNILNSTRELYIFKKLSDYINLYKIKNREYFNIQKLIIVIQNLPRIWIEFVLVLTITIILFFFIEVESSYDMLIIKLSLFIFVSIKLIPSFTKLLSSSQLLRVSKPVIDLITPELVFKKPLKEKKIKIFKKLEVRNLKFKYLSNEKYIINNLSFNINKFDKIAFIGKSGSGKSTLVNLIIGFLKPKSGKIIINNKYEDFNMDCSYVPQEVFIFDETILRNICLNFNNEKINFVKLKKIVKILNLERFINEVMKGFDTKLSNSGDGLSVGQKQRIGIARALYKESKIYIFDEFTSSLDLSTEKEIINSLKIFLKSKTVIIITHRKYPLKICNKTIRL